MAGHATITRRGALSTLIAAAVVAPAAAAGIAVPHGNIALDALIAEFHQRDSSAKQAGQVCAAAYRAFFETHPTPVVHHGKRAATDPATGWTAMNEQGEIVYTTWQFSDPEEVKAHFEWGLGCTHFSDSEKATLRGRRDEILKQIDRLWAAWEEAKDAAGVSDLERAEEAARAAMLAARRAVLAYRPASLGEFEVRDRFIREVFAMRGQHGIGIQWAELAPIFGGASLNQDGG